MPAAVPPRLTALRLRFDWEVSSSSVAALAATATAP